nr:Chain C, Pre-mRNA-processing factor 19 [Mus musculus]
KYRQVASHV